MKIAAIVAFLAVLTAVPALAQQVGTSDAEVHPSYPTETSEPPPTATPATSGTPPFARMEPPVPNCALEGANYEGTYGISASGSDLSLKLVTKGQYSTNVGSRLYVMQDDTKYKLYKLLNQEFSFDVDVSKLPCGLNGALYFVQMDADGGKSKYPGNKAGAAYGTGYCDAQCPHDVKFINGEANVANWKPSATDPNGGTGKYGSCCMEMDIWEANSISSAYTSHPCTVESQTRCTTDAQCGFGSANRYKGVCDEDGCDNNPYRMGNTTFFGPGASFQIDTTKPFTVTTQFITSDKTANGNLAEIKRFFKQNGKVIENPKIKIAGIDPISSITDKVCSQSKTAFKDPDDHKTKGGLAQMTKALKKGVVLTMSLWTDHAAQCLWLDSTYPLDRSPKEPGVARGTCATTTGVPATVEAQSADATVKFSNVRVGDIGSTVPGLPQSGSASTEVSDSTESSSDATASGSSESDSDTGSVTGSADADADSSSTTPSVSGSDASSEAESTPAPVTTAPTTTTPKNTSKKCTRRGA
ncbi:putative glycosyl hydrolase family 7 protein, partial [Globisporangium splendens]